MSLSPDLITQVRSDLPALLARPESVRSNLESVRAGATREAREAAAFQAVRGLLMLRSLGEIASLRGDERDDLLRVGTDGESARSAVRAWVEQLSEPVVFRAFAHVLPYSFRPAISDGLRAHQEQLRRAIREAIWPGVPATLEQLFVPQRCIVKPFAPSTVRPSVRRPVGGTQRERIWESVVVEIEKRVQGPPCGPLVVTGEPGAGKSSLAAMIAGEYAARWGCAPLLLRAASLARPDAASQELFARGEDELAWIDELSIQGRPLVLLDGLDELSGGLLSRVTRWLRGAMERLGSEARFVLFGRPAASVSVAVSLPRETLRVDLLPFEAEQARGWAARWESATGRHFNLEGFLRTSEEQGPWDDAHALEVRDLARAPLTLFLLASIELTGKALPTPKTARGRTAIFRRILDRTASESSAASEGNSDREVLRAAAVVVRLATPGGARRNDVAQRVAAMLGARHPYSEQIVRVLGRFPVAVEPSGDVRFVHASMRDQLVAEFLAQRGNWLLDAMGRAKKLNESQERALVAGWVESFGVVPIDDALLVPLRQMLPDWRVYAQEGRRTKAREDGLRALVPVLYRWLVEDRAAEAVIGVARAQGERPRRVAAIALLNVFALARCVARDDDEPAWFAPEQIVPDSFATAWHIIAAEIDLPDQARRLVSSSVSLRGMHAGSLDRLLLSPFPLHGADLTGADLRGARLLDAALHDVCLDQASLSGARLDGVWLVSASLREVHAIDAQFFGVSLEGADLRGANLRGAAFSHCSLENADLRGADLTGASFLATVVKGAKLDEAIYDPKVFEGMPTATDYAIPF